MLRHAFRLASAAGLFAALMMSSATAQPMDKRTFFTFSGPVAMPGITLPAGQYIFRLADPDMSSRVVEVLSANGRKPYGLFFTISAQRLHASVKPEVRFMETAKDMPQAIQTWWYPDETAGYEFIYPKAQARLLAQGTGNHVLTTAAQTTKTEETNTAKLARVSSSGQETTVEANAKPMAAEPTGTKQEGTVASTDLAIAKPAIPSPVAADTIAPRAAGTMASRTELPQTASSIPAVALVGLIALLGGIGLWGWRTRILASSSRRR